jgi:hypothetical protein
MDRKIQLLEVPNIPIGKLSSLEVYELISLRKEAQENLQKAKHLKEWLDSSISLKYHDRALAARNVEDKITGTINFKDGDFKVSSIVAKKVEWDQGKLEEAVSKIKESGDDANEYVITSYKVSEAKYNAYPEYIKKFFRPARILKLGKENFKIELVSEVDHE